MYVYCIHLSNESHRRQQSRETIKKKAHKNITSSKRNETNTEYTSEIFFHNSDQTYLAFIFDCNCFIFHSLEFSDFVHNVCASVSLGHSLSLPISKQPKINMTQEKIDSEILCPVQKQHCALATEQQMLYFFDFVPFHLSDLNDSVSIYRTSLSLKSNETLQCTKV